MTFAPLPDRNDRLRAVDLPVSEALVHARPTHIFSSAIAKSEGGLLRCDACSGKFRRQHRPASAAHPNPRNHDGLIVIKPAQACCGPVSMEALRFHAVPFSRRRTVLGYDLFKKSSQNRWCPLRLMRSRWRWLAACLHASEGLSEGFAGFVDSGSTRRPAIRLGWIYIFFVGQHGRWSEIATNLANDRSLKSASR